MTAIKCYRFRMEPNTEQEAQFLRFAGCRRFVWNWGLARKKEVYKTTGKGITYNALATELVALKKQAETSFLKECHSQVLQQTLMDLEKGYKAFFEKRSRIPKFKKKKQNLPAFRIPQNVTVTDGKVSVPKVGLVKIRLHRPIGGTVKSATIQQESDGRWYVVFVSHMELPDIPASCNTPAGIDVGLESFVTVSDGEKVKPPKFYRKGERKLTRLSRELSRCQKASKNHVKAKQRLAKHHRRVANQRNDFLHKLSSRLVREHDTLCIEDLNLKGLTKTKLSKSFSDAALGSFLQMLTYKAVFRFGENGFSPGQVIKVGRFFPSSKTCNDCGHVQHLELCDRRWVCRRWVCLCCGVVQDRDINAARNILSEGSRIVAARIVAARIVAARIVAAGMTETQNADRGNVRRATASGSR